MASEHSLSLGVVPVVSGRGRRTSAIPDSMSTALGAEDTRFRALDDGTTLAAGSVQMPPVVGDVISLRPVGFPRHRLHANATFLGLQLQAQDTRSSSADAPASVQLRLTEPPSWCFEGESGPSIVSLESCQHPGLVVAHGGVADSSVRLIVAPTSEEDEPHRCTSAWRLEAPGLNGGEETISLTSAASTREGVRLVARHAFGVLRVAALPRKGELPSELLASDGSWHPLHAASNAPCVVRSGDETLAERAATLMRPTQRATFRLAIGDGDASLQRNLSFHLYGRVAPRTVANFVSLCERRGGGGYTGSVFHRVMRGFMAQGGDNSGRGGGGYGVSASGGLFADETFALSHSARGTLSMANAGKDTNGAQFFATFGPTPHLDGQHVVFGRVTDATAATLDDVEDAGSQGGQTTRRVLVSACDVDTLAREQGAD
uniref:peptidylprolyl isomerase n=1 Tax=Chrysotila carterae TaxID=13221 RepID=A0A7S4C6I3_CHRCT